MTWLLWVSLIVAVSRVTFSCGGPLSASQTAASLSGGLHQTTGGGAVSDVRYIDLMTAPELAESRPELSKLADIYSVTEMKFKLEQSRHVTVLMPSNRAIDKAARHGIDMEHTSYDVSLPILQFFIVPEVIKVSQLEPGTHVFDSMEGSQLTFVKPESSNRPVTVNGQAIGFQIDNANGVAYIMDGMIYPESLDVEGVREHKATHGHGSSRVVPEHVQQTNIAHARYDRSPVNRPAQVDVFDDTVEPGSQGVLRGDMAGGDEINSGTPSAKAEGSQSIKAEQVNVIPGGGVLPAADNSRPVKPQSPPSTGTAYSRASVRRRRRSGA